MNNSRKLEARGLEIKDLLFHIVRISSAKSDTVIVNT